MPKKKKSDSELNALLLKSLDHPETKVSEADFARIVGKDRSVISRLRTRGVLSETNELRICIIQIVSYYKGLAAGVRGSGYV